MHGTLSNATKLYDYQKEAIRKASEVLAAGRSVVLQMPTGSGKTITAAEMIRRESTKGGQVWFVCHRREIIRQASKALSMLGLSHDVIAPNPEKMGLGFAYVPGSPVCIASVQTLSRRQRQDEPRLVVWDECHHAPAGTWYKIKSSLGNSRHLGLTATPERLDGKGLDQWFDELVCGPSIAALIEAGKLARVRMFAPTQPDLTEARIQMGDYRKEDSDAVMNTPVLIGSAVDEYQRHASGSRAIVFATSVEASKRIAERFNQAGIPAKHVDGTTPLDERDAALASLAEGRIKVLSNVEVFTEGVDVPAVDTVILMRPTRSLSLYLQMIGRGMRLAPGKEFLTVFDHAGLVYEHGLPDRFEWDWSIEGGARKRRTVAARHNGEVIRRCPKCSAAHELSLSCPECGYAYPSGREIGECDGVLWEVAEGIPEGSESLKVFAKRIGRSRAGVDLLIDRGMPHSCNAIPVGAAMEWISKNEPKGFPPSEVEDPENYVRPKHFAAVVGIAATSVRRLVDKGLPIAANGWVHLPRGLDFMANYESKHAAPQGVERAVDYLPQNQFSLVVGLSAPTVKACVEKGMPASSNGWVDVEGAKIWLRENYRSPKVPPFDVEDPSEYEGRKEFAHRFKLGVSAVHNWSKRGLPTAANGWVNVNAGLNWVRSNVPPSLIPPAVPNAEEYERPSDFERRVGARPESSYRWDGIPRAENGWIHTRSGLEWFHTVSSRPRVAGKYKARAGNETRRMFCTRTGIGMKRLSALIRAGLPVDNHGWVKTRLALEWVRDNTDVKIPDEAWPQNK